MIYRVHQTLERGNGTCPVGMASLSWLKEKHITILLDRGIISKVATPPLGVLPGWKERAEKLEHLGIIFVVDFLEADDLLLAEIFDEDEQAIVSWKAKLRRWLEVDIPKKKRC